MVATYENKKTGITDTALVALPLLLAFKVSTKIFKPYSV